jgi:prefoldin subunit 5
MREVSELLSQKELELNNLSRQIENISKEVEALRTTLRLLEQAGTTRPVIQESSKRPSASVRGESASRETVVAELP